MYAVRTFLYSYGFEVFAVSKPSKKVFAQAVA